MESKVYSTKEFSERVGISVKTLYNWDKNGTLKARRKVNNYKYYTDEDVAKVFGIDSQG